MGGNRIPGPSGLLREFGLWDLEMGERERSEMGWSDPFASRSIRCFRGPTIDNTKAATKVLKVDKNEEELKLLVTTYGIVKNKAGSKSYVKWEGKKKKYLVDDYVKDRNAFFGSEKDYLDYRKKSHDELDANNKKLRKYVEPPPKKRKKVAKWQEAQDVFYAWVRKAYEKKLGDKVDIPKLIKSQMSEKLKKALKQVKLDYGKSFQSGGFNPRPMKKNGYRLGTISEHAVGTAIDIESAKNAHIETGPWGNILSFTDKALSTADRKSKWKNKPKELHNSIKSINDEFVKKLKKEMEAVVSDARKVAEAEMATAEQKNAYQAVKKDPLSAAVAANPTLKKIGLRFLKKWKNGFYSLPWELVNELHEEGFLWGGTFSHPDLHHFEL
jgi:hypothetical protein